MAKGKAGTGGTKRAALYLRVSTGEQTTANQRRELEEAAARHGWQVVAVFEDAGVSGAKGREGRPGLDAMLKAVARREVDVVAAWSVDRLGRSLADLLGTLGDLHAKGCDLFLLQQGLDTGTPSGRAMFQMLGVFAEFERAMIRERVNSGLARAKAEGTKSGRAIGRPKLGAEAGTRAAAEGAAKRAAILAHHAEGMGKQRIARTLGVGVGTVLRVLAEEERTAEAA